MYQAGRSTRFKGAVLAALVGMSVAGAAAAQEGAVEILSGDRTRVAQGAAGVRVISFLGADRGAAAYRVVEPLRSTEVLAIQEALATAGHDPGAFDGLMGPATRTALRRFQTTSGETACGCVDYATVVGLGLRPLVIQTVIGDAADEPEVEIIVPPRRIEPQAAPPPPAPETVYVATAAPPGGAWVYPAFPVGIPVIVAPGKPVPEPSRPAGVPFGGRGPIRLGPPATRPPPRP